VAILKRVSASTSSIMILASHSIYVTCVAHTEPLNNLHTITVGGIGPRHLHIMLVTGKYRTKGEKYPTVVYIKRNMIPVLRDTQREQT
jgi:uncharacterized protein involved in response to NO